MSISRRKFLGLASVFGMATLTNQLAASVFTKNVTNIFDFKLSLAQWSLHTSLFKKEIDPLDFPVIAKNKFGFDAVEYVSQFFQDKAEDNDYLSALKNRCTDNGVFNNMIMVDLEGPLSDKNKIMRARAVDDHKKWISAAHFLGCPFIRVNLHGEGPAEEWRKASEESLHKLSDFAKESGVEILAENHGGYSSDGTLLKDLIRHVNRNNIHTLVDTANFCVRREKGDLWESPCIEWYDKYKGIQELVPYAKGISAKTFDFDESGNETTIDFKKIFSLIKGTGYTGGYVGVEYEGTRLSEEEGIIATKKLLEKTRDELKSLKSY